MVGDLCRLDATQTERLIDSAARAAADSNCEAGTTFSTNSFERRHGSLR
jgi:hypothetical protein